MRDIIFKGREISTNKIVVGNLLIYEKNAVAFINNRTPNTKENGMPDGFYVIPDTVGQFTGKKDIYGNNIFEGDDVSFMAEQLSTNSMIQCIGIVSFDESLCQFIITKTNSGRYFEFNDPMVLETIEVITHS